MAKKLTKTSGASAGGTARAASLSELERKSIAKRAAASRWGGPKATHAGELKIGDITIECAELEDGMRVLTQEGFLLALGRTGRITWGGKLETPPFLAYASLKPFVSEQLRRNCRPVVFRPVGGGAGTKAYGFAADVLPEVCEVYLKARDAGVLAPSQARVARACEALVRSLARVGIVALVDEATGYQVDRARDELNRILEAYIAEELRPWVRLFPDEFFRQIYRLRGWDYQQGNTRGPRYIGKLVNRYVYDQLPPGVPQKLRELNPAVDGRRKHKHHQLLTEHTGEPHLDKQITVVTTLMRVASDNHDFEALFRKAFPRSGEQQMIRLSDRDEDE